MNVNKNSFLEILKNPFISSNKTKFLAVTKNRSVNDILDLINLGQRLFGENRVQEANEKYKSIQKLGHNQFELHLIGPLQSNKVKLALETFDVIQTIDRKKIVDSISLELTKGNAIKTKNYFIQVNIGLESQKSGVNPDEAYDLYQYALNKQLQINGLMCIPPSNNDPSSFFKKMVTIKNKINQKLLLSMGMSNDYEIALNNGSNIVRIGSKIFK